MVILCITLVTLGIPMVTLYHHGYIPMVKLCIPMFTICIPMVTLYTPMVTMVHSHGYTVHSHGYTVHSHGYAVHTHGYTGNSHGYTVYSHGYTVHSHGYADTPMVTMVHSHGIPMVTLFIAVSDGEWSTWGEWSGCSVSCDGGTRTRVRTCDNPAPSLLGSPCTGESDQSGDCGTTACPCMFVFCIVFWWLQQLTVYLLLCCIVNSCALR